MKLTDFLHPPTRPVWTARLVVYIAFIVTLSIAVQVVQVFFW